MALPAGLGVPTADRDLRIRSWNAWLTAATGQDEAEVRGRPVVDVLPEDRRAATAELLGEIIQTGTSRVLAPAFHRYLLHCPLATPSRHFSEMQQRVTIAPLRSESSVVGVIITIEDVTARLDEERELAARLHERPAGAPPSEAVAAVGADDWRTRGMAVRALRQSATPEEVSHLLESLQRDHQNLNVLHSALQVLVAANRDVLHPLVSLLADPNPNLRMHAALALGEIHDPAVVPALIGALTDDDTNVIFHAIEALGRHGAADAVEPLARIAASGDFFLSFPAIDALARTDDTIVEPTLIALLDQEMLRPAVIDALSALGDEDSVIPLVGLLGTAGVSAAPIAVALDRIRGRYDNSSQSGAHIVDLARRGISDDGIAALAQTVTRRAPPLGPLATVLGWMGEAGLAALIAVIDEPTAEGPVGDAIVRVGAVAVAPLIEQLRTGSARARLTAATLLGRLGDRRAVPALSEILGSVDTDLVAAAAAALAGLADQRSLAAILPLLGHPHAVVRHAAIAAVNGIGAAETREQIRALLSDLNPRVRESAIRVAGYSGFPDCVTGILAALGDEHEDVRRAAIEQLPLIDDQRAWPALLNALHDERPRNRAAAAHALRLADGGDVEPVLLAALNDADHWVRYFAAGALRERGSMRAADRLTAITQADDAPHVRIAALEALRRIDPGAAAVIAAPLIEHDDDDLAGAALGALAGGEVEVDDVLEHAVRSPRSALRTAAVRALARRGRTRGVAALAWVARAADTSGLRAQAVDALCEVAGADAQGSAGAVAALLELGIERPHGDEIAAALGKLPADAIGELAGALSSPRVGTRVLAVDALARMRDQQASAALALALDDADPRVRGAAVMAFGRLGTIAVSRAIATMRTADPDDGVRRRAVAACRRHGWDHADPAEPGGRR